MSLETPSFKCAGTIYPARFVNIDLTQDSGLDFYVEENVIANNQHALIGISDIAGKDGRHDVNNTSAAQDGDMIKVYGMGSVCLLEMAATCSRGDHLISNQTTDGKGIPASKATGAGIQYYGAKALEACTQSGQKIRVQVMFGYIPSGGQVD